MARPEHQIVGGPPYPPGTEPARIRADIDRTRADMDETIAALEQRLRPGNVMRRALGPAHGVSVRVAESFRRNPQIVAAVAVGVVAVLLGRALAVRRRRRRRLEYSI